MRSIQLTIAFYLPSWIPLRLAILGANIFTGDSSLNWARS